MATAQTGSVADHPAVAPLVALAKKDAYGAVLTAPAEVGFRRIEKGPNAGKWVRAEGVHVGTVPDRTRRVGDVSGGPQGDGYIVRIAVPHAVGFSPAAQSVRQAVRDALPGLRQIAEERFLAANPGAEFFGDARR